MNGTLNYKFENNEHWFEIDANYETELMIKRLIPSAKSYPLLSVRMHPENTRILRMVMSEFPLDIKTEKWNEAIMQIKEVNELAEKLARLEYEEPSSANFLLTLRDFQKQGLNFLNKTKGVTLLCDEMGLGKTIQTLAYIANNPKEMPVIIVSPLVTLRNWQREIERSLKLMYEDVYMQKRLDLPESRTPLVNIIRSGERKDLPPADFHIINYDLLFKRARDIIAINPKTIIADEIQNVRNYGTRRYEAMKFVMSHPSVKHKIGLSGTPLYNRGIEMFNIIELIQAGLLGERDEYVRRYCYYTLSDQTDRDSQETLATKLRNSIMIRRLKQDVLKDLPDKVKMKHTIPIDGELYSRGLEKLFERIAKARENLEQAELEDEKKEGLFELNKKVREMRIGERQIAGLAKAPYVIEYLSELMDDYNEEKFVVFAHHISVHKLIFEGLRKFKPMKIIGGQKDNERQENIDRFQNDKDCKLAICGLQAGNVGINLTAGSYVIFAELDWSPSVHLQAEDRLHRIGQKNTVFSHYLEGEGTFDEFLSTKLLEKRVTINAVLGDKMESLDNKTALEFLEKKFKISSMKQSVIVESMSNLSES